VKRLMTEKEAAEYLSISVSYIRKTRSCPQFRGKSVPPWIRIGAAVRYDVGELDKWIAANKHKRG